MALFLQYGNNYDRKNFHSTGHRGLCSNTFTIVILLLPSKLVHYSTFTLVKHLGAQVKPNNVEYLLPSSTLGQNCKWYSHKHGSLLRCQINYITKKCYCTSPSKQTTLGLYSKAFYGRIFFCIVRHCQSQTP
jgi:hypothetical protein